MKTRVLFFLLSASFVALAAWFVHAPNAAQANDVPEKYRETVHRGLEYLAKSQCADGRWEGERGQHPVAMTGLAGIALLMEGSDGRRDEVNFTYSANIGKAVDWLLDKSQTHAGRDGLIFSDHPSETGRYMYGHALATLFLAGAYDHERDRDRRQKLREVLTRAVKYIVKAQSTQGGWYHTSKMEGHDFAAISATVVQMQALQGVSLAGIPIADEAVNDGLEYLQMELAKIHEEARPGQKRGRATETAAALALRAEHELSQKWFKVCQNEIPVGRGVQLGRDELTHYYYAQAVFLFSHRDDDGESKRSSTDAAYLFALWNDYRTAMFDHLQSSQNKDGSWPASVDSQEGIGAGPVCSTAMWCTVLQLDRNLHPSTRWIRAKIK